MNSVISRVRLFTPSPHTFSPTPAYAFVEALVVVCIPPHPVPISADSFIQDTHGRPLCCNQRHAIFHISAGEAHILRLARMLSLYCMHFPFVLCHISPFHSDWFCHHRSQWHVLGQFISPPSLIPLLGPQEQTPSEISVFQSMFTAPSFLAYISVLITIALSIIFYFGPKSVFPPFLLPHSPRLLSGMERTT